MHDEPLTPEERAAFGRLPREMNPPSHLEDRTVDALRRAGHLAPRSARRWWARAAAAIALVFAGIVIGRSTSGPPPGGSSAEPAYLLLLYGGDAAGPDEPSRYAEYAAWAGQLRSRDALIAAERLAPDARVLGEAPPARESQPVGFFLIRAATVEAAAAVARSCPHLKYGGTVVVRPIG